MSRIRPPAARRRDRPPWRVACVGGLFLGALVALSLALAAPGSGAPDGPDAAARLASLAAAAARQPPVGSVPSGRYRYLRWREAAVATTGGPAGQFSRLEYRTSERWARSDGSGRWRATCGASVLVGPRDRGRWRAAGSPGDTLCAGEDQPVGPGLLSSGVPLSDRLGDLPTDPRRLEARLRAAGRPYRQRLQDAEVFALLGQLAEVPEAPPRLRAALIRVAGRLRGLDVGDETRDPAGRLGVAVALSAGTFRRELILSPTTAAILGERTVLERPVDWADARPGHVLSWVVYLDSAVVDAMRPPGV